MTIKQALNWAIKKLKKSKIYPVKWSRSEFNRVNSAVLDAEVLLSFAIKKSKEWILTHPEANLKTQEYKKLIERRCKHEPVAYITKTREFFGLNFFVDKNVLIPRPETEMMVEKVLEIIKESKRKIYPVKCRKAAIPFAELFNRVNLIDIGTGSGCIPISIIKTFSTTLHGRSKLWTPELENFAVDYSAKALEVARKNAAKHKVKIKFLKGDLLSPLKKLPAGEIIITANLPYLSELQYKKLPPEIKKYEPKSALIAGKDGLKYYRELLLSLSSSGLSGGSKKIKGLDSPNKSWNDITLLLEIDPAQTKKIKKIISKILPDAKTAIQKDLAKRDRLVIIKIN